MNKKEKEALITQINEYLPELKTEIDSAKNNLKEARSLKTSIENVVKASNELLDRLQDPDSGVDKLLSDSGVQLSTIASNAETAESLVDAIQSNLEAASQHVSEMQSTYDNFLLTKDKIDDPESGLIATLDIVRELRRQARIASTSAATLLDEAKRVLTRVNAYMVNIDEAYNDFLISKKRIDDPTDGLDAILAAMKKLRDSISSIADQSATLFKNISEFRDEAFKSLEGIKKNRTDSGQALAEIKQNKTESEEAKKSIETLLKIASQESSTAYFKKRTFFVTIVAGVWLVLGIVALLIAVSIGSQLVNDIAQNQSDTALVVARVFVITPLAGFSVYAFRNYGKERTIAEQYAFKEISGATLEGHVEMAHRALPSTKDLDGKLLSVMSDVLKDIHTEPYELKKSQVMSLSAKSKPFDLKAEISDIGDNVEDIKDVVTKSKSS